VFLPQKNKKAALGPCLYPTELAFAQARFPANHVCWFSSQVEAKQRLTVSIRQRRKDLLDDSCGFLLHSTTLRPGIEVPVSVAPGVNLCQIRLSL
jgi:hypothetical protein